MVLKRNVCRNRRLQLAMRSFSVYFEILKENCWLLKNLYLHEFKNFKNVDPEHCGGKMKLLILKTKNIRKQRSKAKRMLKLLKIKIEADMRHC